MSNDADGFGKAGPPPPGQQQPGQPPWGYHGYPPPGYGPPAGYGPPPGYWPPGYGPPPGYGGFPGYRASAAPKPGVIPLRPLSMSEIFNGSVAYIRTNPKATLGLTTVVVIIAQIIVLILEAGPLAVAGGLGATLDGDAPATAALVGSSASGIAAAVVTGVSGILLSGMLTVVIGRAVFGSTITIAEAWQRLRGRILALLGFAALAAVAVVALVGVVVLVIAVIANAVGGAAAVVVGIPLVLGAFALLIYFGTMLGFVAPLIVLERLDIVSAITRSFTLVHNDFWRLFGIRLLAGIVAWVIAAAVSVPFSLGGQVLVMSSASSGGAFVGLLIMAIGSAIGEIITAPFSAGVVVLLYTDRRIRAEAFDLVLLTGAAPAYAGHTDSTDHLWLTRQR